KIGVSRFAVCKAIKTLKSDGYNIESVTNKGYTLQKNSDVLTVETLKNGLCKELQNVSINVFNEVTSTNILAKEAAAKGENDCPNGSIFLANRQTGGHGRRSRAFFSPSGGIYLSFVLRPTLEIAKTVCLTSCAAVAVSRAIKTVCNIDTNVKWVNDIFYNGKKLCGILTEAAVSIENNTLEYAAIGIGINFFMPTCDVPKELQDVITAIYTEKPDGEIRTRLVCEICNNLFCLEQTPDSKEILAEYKALNFIIDKKITVLSTPPKTAVARDINELGNLIVEYENGEIGIISSGEVSIKPLQ
ncbi:MAG: biotin--[acetyl-CoA-carboxylase] ligase, partial [Oscillospiraceae bacterium]